MAAKVLVFAPAPLLTITVEDRGDEPDIHIHAGGQGVWIARMLASLEIDVVLCGSFGGETGHVARTLVEHEGIDVRAVTPDTPNPAYVHDRRSGERVEVAEMPACPLTRHDLDELYGIALVEGLEAQVAVLGGPSEAGVVPADVYARMAADLRANGTCVVADLSGEPLDGVLAGGVTVLKVSHEELLAGGRAAGDSVPDLVRAMLDLRAAGATDVVVSRAGDPALALVGAAVYEVAVPPLAAADPRGAGDSMTAGLAAGLARGASPTAAVCLGAAAGALNVTRRGLGTGERTEIERLATHVELRPLPIDVPAGGTSGLGDAGGDEDRAGRRDRQTTPDELAAKVRMQ